MKLPQLSLRELFLLVLIAAMGCGWCVEHARTLKERRADKEEIERLTAEQEKVKDYRELIEMLYVVRGSQSYGGQWNYSQNLSDGFHIDVKLLGPK